MRSGHLPWAKKEHTGKLIDLEEVFGDYWSSKKRELTVLGQSRDSQPVRLYLIEKRRGR